MDTEIIGLPRPIHSGKRRDGNTTRLVDYYIQLLFIHTTIIVFEKQENINTSKYLFKKIIKRLESEYSTMFLYEKITYNETDLTIKIIKW